MFRGANNINLDAKGRLAIPTRYRELLADHCNGEMVVTIDTEEKALLVYMRPEWEDLQRKLEKLPSFDRSARRLKRLLLGYATDIQLDGSGRLLLTPPLREYAMLDKKTVLLGQGNLLELWSEEHWLVRRQEFIDDDLSSELSTHLENFSL